MPAHPIPNSLLGVMVTTAADGNHRIGIEIELAEPIDAGNDTLQFPVQYHFFVNPPTIAVGDQGSLSVNLRSGSAHLTSESQSFRFDAKFSEDFQTLKGRAYVENFQLMDIAGTFHNCEMILEADDYLES